MLLSIIAGENVHATIKVIYPMDTAAHSVHSLEKEVS